MPVELVSNFTALLLEAEARTDEAVAATCMAIESDARRNLVSNGSVKTGNLVSSIESDVGGHQGEVGTSVEYAPYVEYGTGARGQESHFEGKPDDLTYTPGWAGMSARPYLTPAAEAQRGPFLIAMSEVFG